MRDGNGLGKWSIGDPPLPWVSHGTFRFCIGVRGSLNLTVAKFNFSCFWRSTTKFLKILQIRCSMGEISSTFLYQVNVQKFWFGTAPNPQKSMFKVEVVRLVRLGCAF